MVQRFFLEQQENNITIDFISRFESELYPNSNSDRLHDDNKAIRVSSFALKLKEAEPEVTIVWIKRRTRLIKASLRNESREENNERFVPKSREVIIMRG